MSSNENLFANLPGTVAPAAAPEPEVETAETDSFQGPSELDMLKSRAKLMGLKVSPNIGLDALKAKINEKLTSETAAQDEPAVPETSPATPEATSPVMREATKPMAKTTPMSLRQKLLKEQMKLVRLRITNLDPKKAKLQGEIITVANEYLGTVKKFVPFGETTDEGYHVPFCIYTVLKERTFVQIKTKKDKKTGTNFVESRDVREFALEVLPPLTERELAHLAASQAAAGGVE